MTDVELLEAWRAGDAAAGQKLFERYFQQVCRFFYNKVDEGVEDLIQQTFLACAESRDRFRGDSSFFTFLIGVAKNVLRVHYRKKKKDDRIDFGTVSVFDLTPSPSKVAAERGDQRVLLDALRQIPLDLQTALELHYWEDMSATEISRALEIPSGTAKSRLRRGKELLRERLTETNPDASDSDEEMLGRRVQSLKQVLPGPE